MKLTKSQIRLATKDKGWQSFRVKLKDKTTKSKLKSLEAYLITHPNSNKAKVQVQNYINALKRAGQL